MTHQYIHIHDYHEGDTLELEVVVEDRNGERVDISGGAVEWLLKDRERDPDTDALLRKDSRESEVQAELTDPENGEAIVYIDTGDTDGLLPDSEAVEQETFHHRCRVTNAEGDRSTVFHGDFTINA